MLPVNKLANTVLVVKLEFDQLPGAANVTRETDDLLQR
jgi:hypothetical protein